MDKITLEKLESVNQIKLTDEEREEFLNNYKKLDDEFKILEEIDTKDVEPMVHVIPINNVPREDLEIKKFTRDELQEGSKDVYDGYWQVPRLVE